MGAPPAAGSRAAGAARVGAGGTLQRACASPRTATGVAVAVACRVRVVLGLGAQFPAPLGGCAGGVPCGPGLRRSRGHRGAPDCRLPGAGCAGAGRAVPRAPWGLRRWCALRAGISPGTAATGVAVAVACRVRDASWLGPQFPAPPWGLRRWCALRAWASPALRPPGCPGLSRAGCGMRRGWARSSPRPFRYTVLANSRIHSSKVISGFQPSSALRRAESAVMWRTSPRRNSPVTTGDGPRGPRRGRGRGRPPCEGCRSPCCTR